MLIVHCILE